ncbi:MAG: Cof-type HAD-IIB family hydrolase [Clostridia bacterium]|nr:Cof-type HAD-IIB family hydrolase [Clostridia bacterium]
MVRLVAIDLDGTMLRSDVTISERTREAVKEARARGVMVAVATGRMYRSARLLVSGLAHDLPIAAYNGALIRMSGSGETLASSPVPVDAGERIVRFMWDWGIAFQGYFNDELWAPRASARSDSYGMRYGVSVHVLNDVDEFVRRESLKYLVIDDPARIPSIKAALESVAGPDLRLMRSKPDMIEIVNSSVSKLTALRHLAQMCGISMSETMAIGDQENDIEMIRGAGLGVAVGNGEAEVIQAADCVVASNDDDGVAEALERYVLLRR